VTACPWCYHDPCATPVECARRQSVYNAMAAGQARLLRERDNPTRPTIGRPVRRQWGQAPAEPRKRSGRGPEAQVLDEVREALSGTCLLWRNSTGMATMGAGKMRFGLAVGSADLVGLRRRDGRFVAIEVKAEHGRTTPAQDAWLAQVRAANGIGAVVRNAREALDAVR